MTRPFTLLFVLALHAITASPISTQQPQPDAEITSTERPTLTSEILADFARCMSLDDFLASDPAIRMQVCDPTVTASIFANTYGEEAMEKMYDNGVRSVRSYGHLLESGVEQTPQGHLRALSVAVCHHNHPLIAALSDLDDEDGDESEVGLAALRGAAECGRVDLVPWIQSRFDLDLKALSSPAIQELFQVALANGQIDFVEWMQSAHKWKLTDRERFGNAFVDVCRRGDVDTVLYILADTVGLESSKRKMANGFIAAASRGHVNIMQLLLPHLWSLSNVESVGIDAGLEAIQRHHANVVAMLLAQPQFAPSAVGPLYEAAAYHNHLDIMALIFKMHPKQLKNLVEIFATPLIQAARDGHLEMVRLIFEHGRPEQDAINTALGYALGLRRRSIADYLLTEAPKRAHGPKGTFPFLRGPKVNAWSIGIVEALNHNDAETALKLLETKHYAPSQSEKNDIFCAAKDVSSRHFLVANGIKPSQEGFNQALSASSHDLAALLDLFEYAGYELGPSREAIDAAFGYYPPNHRHEIRRYYGVGYMVPSFRHLVNVLRHYAINPTEVDIDLLVRFERQQLGGALLETLAGNFYPEEFARLYHLLRQL